MSRDLGIAAATAFGEARGEPDVGIAAVVWTIVNRANADLHDDRKPDWWGEGIANVALRSYQYSCWNSPRIVEGRDVMQSQRSRLLSLFEHKDLLHAVPTATALADPTFEKCLSIAKAVLEDRFPDPTNGATHYYAPWVPEPLWARGHKPSAIINSHRFYNDVEPGYEQPRRDEVMPHQRTILQQGARGKLVKDLQTALVQNGVDVSIDGDFGPKTHTAVGVFQTRRGLTVDGIVGRQTWDALYNGDVP